MFALLVAMLYDIMNTPSKMSQPCSAAARAVSLIVRENGTGAGAGFST